MSVVKKGGNKTTTYLALGFVVLLLLPLHWR